MGVAATADFDPRETIPPPGWPRAATPLTIALLGWARLSYQANQGSGYNLSASELAAGLAMSGHRVLYLASGRKYNLLPWASISMTERWRGVDCFDLVNSPNLSPAAYNIANQAKERKAGRQTRLVLAWLKRRAVQVVHIHSLEGFPLGLIGAIRDRGIPVVVTPHNYWYACPQVDLMHGEHELCTDYQGGSRCQTCLKRRTPWLHRAKRRWGQAFESIVGQEATGAFRMLAKALSRRASRVARGLPAEAAPNAKLADPEAATGLDVRAGTFDDGVVRVNLAVEATDRVRRPVGRTPIDANERFLRADHHLTVVNEYGHRRVQGVAALAGAGLVTPPSDFVRRVYVRLGLPEERTRVVRLGQPHFDQINRRAKRSPYYGVRPWDPDHSDRPLRFSFLGVMRPSKGIDILAEAIGLLPTVVRKRCQFHIRAQGFDWPVRKALSVYPEVAFGGGYDILQLLGEAGEYDVGILPHVWFENSPLVMLEHLHAGKFVIASRLGGVVEWIDPPRNGVLFAGGHADQLAACISRLATGQTPIPSAREIHEATPLLQSYPGHVVEIESIYREQLIGRGSRTPVEPAVRTAAAVPA